MPRPLEDATGLIIHGPLSFAKQSDITARKMRQKERIVMYMFRTYNRNMLIYNKGRSALTGSGERCLTAEFLVLRGKHKGLRNNMEVFEAMSLLHSLDVFIQAVFACQFIWPGNEQSFRFKILHSTDFDADRTKIYAYITAIDRPLADSMIHFMFQRGTGPNYMRFAVDANTHTAWIDGLRMAQWWYL